MNMFFCKNHPNAIIPRYATDGSAGLDMYALINSDSNEITINPDETILFNTGIIGIIPEGYFGGLYNRSGLSIKHNIVLANKVGIIDSDYRGEIKVALRNMSDVPFTVHHGDRIAQLIIQPYTKVTLDEHDISKLDTNTQRSTGGFGSTGTN